jgi:hypothetical protein
MIGRPHCRSRRFRLTEGMSGRAMLLLAMMMAAPLAHAEGLASHSVSYDAKVAADVEKTYAEGQGTFSLTRSCSGWTLGEVFQFAIEKGETAAPKQLGAKADRSEERLNAVESTDGRTLSYQSRLRLNARVTSATGTATLGATAGRLSANLGTYTQNSDLPAGTLAPGAARAALLEALLANKPDPIEIRSVELMRFHKPIMQRFQRLPANDPTLPPGLPKDMHVSDAAFAKGRLWALRRRVGDFNEFGDEFWLMHESGAIVRQLLSRQGTKLLLDAREVTLFPPPACP